MATDTRSAYTSFETESLGQRVLSLVSSDSFAAAALFFAFSVLYWATRTRYNTFDAVSYANQIGRLYEKTGNIHWLFHPQHLLFNVMNYLIWRWSKMIGYVGGPLIVMERVNAFFGAGGIAVFYLTLRRMITRSHGLPVLTAAGLAVSFGYWVCATDGRVNIPSLFFMMAAFYGLMGLLEKASAGRASAVGALAGLSFLFHESAGLFMLVGLAGAAMASDRSQRLRIMSAYLGTWIATVTVPYFLVATVALHLHSLSAFHQWVSAYSELGWWWSFSILHNLRLDLYALRHAAFAEPPGKQGTFSLANHIPLGIRFLYFGALAGWFVAVYGFFAALPLLWRSHHRPVLIICLLWIALYAAFFTVWSPGYFVFWVPALVPLGLLLALGMSHYRFGRSGIWINWLVALWIVLYALVNWTDSIGPHLQHDANPFQRIAANIKVHTKPGDLVMLAGAGEQGQLEVFVPYFANRDVISLHSLLTHAHNSKAHAYADARARMQAAWNSGHSVYGLDELWHGPQAWAALRKKHPGVGPGDLQGWAVPNPSPAWVDLHGKPVWLLVPFSQSSPSPFPVPVAGTGH